MGDGIARNASRAAGAWRIRGATRGCGHPAATPRSCRSTSRPSGCSTICTIRVSAPSASPCCTTSSTGRARAAADGRLVSLAVGAVPPARLVRSCRPRRRRARAGRGSMRSRTVSPASARLLPMGGSDCGVRVQEHLRTSAAGGDHGGPWAGRDRDRRVMAGAITLASAGAVFQAVLDDDLHADRAEPGCSSRVDRRAARRDPPRRIDVPSGVRVRLSDSMWLLVGLCAIGTVLTWAFVAIGMAAFASGSAVAGVSDSERCWSPDASCRAWAELGTPAGA